MAGKRVRLTADARRAQLVDEATVLIARNGYHRFSITALAEAAGLTRAGVLHHLGSKEQLLLGGFDRPAAEVAVEVYAFMDGIQLNWLRDPAIDMWHQWTSFADALFANRPAIH